jgi:hypothetical protein
VFISKEDPLTRENTMNLWDAAREDLARKTFDQLVQLRVTDSTGLVATELDRRAERAARGEAFLRKSFGPTRDEVIAQPNS